MSKSLFTYQNNKLLFNGQPVESFLQLQTPFIIYSLEIIQQRLEWIKSWKNKNPKCNNRLHFAMKANYNPQVLATICKSGAGIDVVSLGEIEHALKCGFLTEDIIFSGVGKTKREIEKAIDYEIYQINVESVPELKRIAHIAQQSVTKLSEQKIKKVSIGLRMNPIVDAQTHHNIATALKDSKFGLSLSDMEECFSIIEKSNTLELKGISYHLGSQIMNPEFFREALIKVKPLFKKWQAQFPSLDRWDLGGGLGIDYKNHDMALDEKRWLDLKNIYETELEDINAHFILEMGRFIVARSGILIGQVQYIKKTENKEIVILDMGMNNLMRPSLYQAYHHILPLVQREQKKKYMFVGPICESSDVFHEEHASTELKQDDYAAICDVGAYGSSMASDYNKQPIATEIVF